MNRPDLSLVQPRKTARQARSIATTEAIQQATIQALLAEGVGRLTTTRVAERAGVSVGTLYQYFPHKQALLFGIVERQFDLIEGAMRVACDQLHGCDLAVIAEGLTTAWLDAKTADIVASRAVYGIAAEFDLSGQMGRAATLMGEAFETLLVSAPGVRFRDPPAAAFMLAALLGGGVRVVMEADPSGHSLERLHSELPRACHAYLLSASEPV